jgi:predicted transcriptional regulator
MKKTSVYLDEADKARLERLAGDLGLSQAEVVRRALAEFELQCRPRGHFHLLGIAAGDGRSIADFTEEEMAELMKGFGED